MFYNPPTSTWILWITQSFLFWRERAGRQSGVRCCCSLQLAARRQDSSPEPLGIRWKSANRRLPEWQQAPLIAPFFTRGLLAQWKRPTTRHRASSKSVTHSVGRRTRMYARNRFCHITRRRVSSGSSPTFLPTKAHFPQKSCSTDLESSWWDTAPEAGPC